MEPESLLEEAGAQGREAAEWKAATAVGSTSVRSNPVTRPVKLHLIPLDRSF